MMETFPSNYFQNALFLAYILFEKKLFLSYLLFKYSLQLDRMD